MPQRLWADVPIVAPAPFKALGTLEDLGAAVTGLTDQDDSGDLARFLDLVVRLSATDRGAVQQWLRLSAHLREPAQRRPGAVSAQYAEPRGRRTGVR